MNRRQHLTFILCLAFFLLTLAIMVPDTTTARDRLLYKDDLALAQSPAPWAVNTYAGWMEIGPGSASGAGISSSSSHSHEPALVTFGQKAIVAWEEAVESFNSEVYLRRWPGPAWVEIGPKSATSGGISKDSSLSRMPSLAVDRDGFPTIAWRDGETDGSEIYVKRWTGASWEELGGSASGGGISNNEDWSDHPALAVDHDGLPVVAWVDYTHAVGNGDIYVNRWNGTAWVELGGSASGGGISDNSGRSDHPSIAIDHDGLPIVVWDNYPANLPGSKTEIYIKHWDGAAWMEVGEGSATGGGISDNSSGAANPSLAVGSDGLPIVAWENWANGAMEIYLKQWNGEAWVEIGGSASAGGISNNINLSQFASLAVDLDGLPIVAWQNDTSAGTMEIYARRWNGATWQEMDGSASGGGISSSDAWARAPSLTIDPHGMPMVTWSDTSSGLDKIYMKRWAGSEWMEMGGSASAWGVSNNEGPSRAPSIGVDMHGQPIIAWEDYSSDNGEVYLRRLDNAAWEELGGSTSGGGISSTIGKSYRTAVTVDPQGSPIVAWEEYKTSQNSEIYLKHWNEDARSWQELGGSATGGGISSNGGFPGASTRPSLAYISEGPVVAWQNWSSYEDNHAYQIFVRHWNGANWVEMGTASASGGGISKSLGNAYTPAAAVLPDGKPIIAWADTVSGSSQIYMKRWNGAAWAEFSSGSASGSGISSTIAYSFRPSLIVDQDGLPIVSWEDNTYGNYEIYLKRWNGTAWVEMGGSATGGGISSTADDSKWPFLAIDPNGLLAVAWQEEKTEGTMVYVKRWNEDAGSWEEMDSGSASGGGISSSSPHHSLLPSLAYTANGMAIVAWESMPDIPSSISEDNRAASEYSQIYARRHGSRALIHMPLIVYKWED